MLGDKDEAGRAKALAEKKFAEEDLDGAKRFALKAQHLYSELDGLHQLLVTLDVHISFRERFNGVVDWYRVIGVEPLADDETIKRSYRKLALILHPDKNRSIGAESAFQIISEAWSLLSDKSKRIAYDQMWKNTFAQVLLIQKSSPSMPTTGQNSFEASSLLSDKSKKTAYHQKFAEVLIQKSSASSMPTGTQKSSPSMPTPRRRSKPASFWTVCSFCKVDFEYTRGFLNQKLLCPNCHNSFVAVETTSPPPNSQKFPTQWSAYKKKQNSRQTTVDENSSSLRRKPAPATTTARSAGSFGIDILRNAFQTDSFFKQGSIRGEPNPYPSPIAAQVAREVQPSCGKLKRAREEAATSFFSEVYFRMKTNAFKQEVSGLSTGSTSAVSSYVTEGDKLKRRRHNDEKEMAKQTSTGNGGVCLFGYESDSFQTRKVNIAANQKPNGSRELSQLEIGSLLMNKARNEIGNRLGGWNMNASKLLHPLQ